MRDLVWAPATLTFRDGSETLGFIPTRYPGTAQEVSDPLRLGRATAWTETAGLGQRMLCTSAAEFALLDLREIAFEHTSAGMVRHG